MHSICCKRNSGKITKIKPFTEKYNWEGIKYPSVKDDWEKMDTNKLKIALHVLHAKEIYPAYVLKHISKHEK